MKNNKSSSPRALRSQGSDKIITSSWATNELRDTHRYFNRFVMSNRGPNPYRSEIFFFQVAVQKSRNYLQNLLQVKTC